MKGEKMNRPVQTVLVFLMLLTLPVWAYAQQSSHEHGQSAPASKKSAKGAARQGGEPHEMRMMEQCKEMMAKHDTMVTEMKAMDARLDEKLAAVKNGKTSDEKLTALEAVVVELSAQRKQMHGLMGDMHHAGMRCGAMKGGMMHGKMDSRMGDKRDAPGAMRHRGRGGMGCCAMMMDHPQGHGDHPAGAPREETGGKQ
jgi:hypothetical protein